MEDDIMELLEDAAMDGVISCPECGTSLEPDCEECGECGCKNPLIELGMI